MATVVGKTSTRIDQLLADLVTTAAMVDGSPMTVDQIPEGGWPEVPVVAPYEYEQLPVFETELLDIQQEGLVEEVIRFYEDTLIPQLACAPDGSSSPHPKIGWLKSASDPRHVVACKIDGELHGALVHCGCMQWSVLFMS